MTLTVTDSPIPEGGSDVVLAGLQTQNFNLIVQPTGTITVTTVNAGATTACTGGTFNDVAGNALPAAVNGRTYGGPGRCDVLFQITNGAGPFTWTITSIPAYLTCTQEPTGGAQGDRRRRLRCNSAGAGATADATPLDVEVADNNGVTTASDVNGHVVHTIAVNVSWH